MSWTDRLGSKRRLAQLALLAGFVSLGADARAEDAPAGVDLSKLTDGEKKIFFQVAGKAGSACGKAHSLLVSVKQDAKCKRSPFALRYIARLVGSGYVASEVEEAVERRYAQKSVKLDLKDVPFRGDARAPLELVEFVDFQCPHCKGAQPMLHELLDAYRGKLKVYFKHFPLSSHPNAAQAAEVAAAASRQGKFWALAAELWKNQDRMSLGDVEKYAESVGVNWKQLDLGFGKKVVARDRAEGEKLKLEGTPTFYLNGRQVVDIRDPKDFHEWFEEELACR